MPRWQKRKSAHTEIIPHIDWASLDVSQYFKKLQIKDVMILIEEIDESEASLISKIQENQTTPNWKVEPTSVKREFW